MEIVQKLINSTYTLVEVNNTVSYLRFAAFCLILYYFFSQKYLKIMELINKKDLDVIDIEKRKGIIEDMTRILFSERKKEIWK